MFVFSFEEGEHHGNCYGLPVKNFNYIFALNNLLDSTSPDPNGLLHKSGGKTSSSLRDRALSRERKSGPLRFLTLNVFHGFPKFKNLSVRLGLIADEINRLDPDVVMLQEVPWRSGHDLAVDILSKSTGMNYVYIRSNGNVETLGFEEGSAILSRFPLRNPVFKAY